MVFEVDRFERSNASLIRCASHQDSVGADWPSSIYPSQTSLSTSNTLLMRGNDVKNSSPSSTVILRTSAMVFPLKRTSSVSGLYRLPRQDSHSI